MQNPLSFKLQYIPNFNSYRNQKLNSSYYSKLHPIKKVSRITSFPEKVFFVIPKEYKNGFIGM